MYSLPENFIKEHNIEVVYQFPVLHSGWECDYNGWVVEDKSTKERKIVLSSHCQPYFATIEELSSLVESYQDTVNKTKTALKLLLGDKK